LSDEDEPVAATVATPESAVTLEFERYMEMSWDTFDTSKVSKGECMELVWWKHAAIRLPVMGLLVRWCWSV
jgi:hypothetical protein